MGLPHQGGRWLWGSYPTSGQPPQIQQQQAQQQPPPDPPPDQPPSGS